MEYLVSVDWVWLYCHNLERVTNIEVGKRDPATSDSAGPAICLLFFYRPKSHDQTSSPNNETYDNGMEFRQNLIDGFHSDVIKL